MTDMLVVDDLIFAALATHPVPPGISLAYVPCGWCVAWDMVAGIMPGADLCLVTRGIAGTHQINFCFSGDDEDWMFRFGQVDGGIWRRAVVDHVRNAVKERLLK